MLRDDSIIQDEKRRVHGKRKHTGHGGKTHEIHQVKNTSSID